ncbi:MAG: beta-galactosidase BgaS [Desulfurococcaceae archaeon]
MIEFPSSFKWGISQSGFQFEMGDRYRRHIDTNTDWWHWARDPYNISSRIVSGDLPEDGIDYFGLYKVDHDNASWLGTSIYRIGIEWSRIFPHPTYFIDVDVEYDGNDLVKDVKVTDETIEQLDTIANHEAISTYRDIILDLRKRGFKVIVNLMHFTLPYWIHNPIRARESNLSKGPTGLLEKYFPVEFAKYAAYMASKLGDIVDTWSTMNEPMVPIELGFMAPYSGFPPGVNKPDVLPKVFLNTVLAHSLAYKLIKRFDKIKADPDSREPAEVGLIHNLIPAYQLDESSAKSSEHYNYFHNYMILDAITKGKVDTGFDEKSYIKLGSSENTLDWLGVNYYTRLVIRRKEKNPLPILDFEAVVGYGYACVPYSFSKAGRWCDGMGWEMFPEGLLDSITMASRYSSILYVTENGTSDHRDIMRSKFILSNIYALHRAIEQGVKVHGYLYWSINDNYEWAHGFRQKFGLFEVNLITKERQARASAVLYRDVVRSNGIKPDQINMIIYEEKSPGSII